MGTFIGGSVQSRLAAEQTAQEIATEGHPVVSWWNLASRDGSKYRLDQLIELSRLCDSAVFVLRAGDEEWPRDQGDAPQVDLSGPPHEHSVIDNLILEYGIFAARLGNERMFLLTDPRVRRSLPRELQDRVIPIDEAGSVARISRELAALAANIHMPVRQDISIYTHKRGHDVLPHEESAKIAYRGIRGAEAWAALERDPRYFEKRAYARVAAFLGSSKLAGHLQQAKNVVSFGPGIGKNDCEAVAAIRFRSAQYIPVDINFYLAVYAAHFVDQGNHTVRSVTGIVADFEEDWKFIAETVKTCASGPKVYMMLGGTFGNIERSETQFLENISAIMESGDYFILDSFFASPGYKVENDRLMNPSKYTKRMREFLANGIAQREKISWQEAIEKFEDLIDVDAEENTGAEAWGHIIIRSKPSSHTIMSIRRHDLARVLELAEQKRLFILDRVSFPLDDSVARNVIVFTRDESLATKISPEGLSRPPPSDVGPRGRKAGKAL